MRFPVHQRLAALGALILALAALIVWAALTSWNQARLLRERFSRMQIENFDVADELQSAVLQLDAALLRGVAARDPAAWQDFDSESRRLVSWLQSRRDSLTTARERDLLERVRASLAIYLDRAREAAGARSPSLEGMVDSAALQAARRDLLSLDNELGAAQRVAFGEFLQSMQRSLRALQSVISAALAALLALGGWALAIVYQELIAPLRLKLVESRALAERHEKLASLGTLAAGVAHEIRNPLTAIKARLYTQQKLLAPGSPEHTDAGFIGKEIQRLERIVRDFLDFARPAEPESAPVQPGALLREVRELLQPQMEKMGVELALGPCVDAPVAGDAAQLKQVLINLAQNAAESIGEERGGRVTLRAHMGRLPGAARAEAVVLEVADNGQGIPPEVRGRLFDPFFTTKGSGTGLGLSIAARIVEKHGGSLQFQTRPGRGTTFGVILPLARNLALPRAVRHQGRDDYP